MQPFFADTVCPWGHRGVVARSLFQSVSRQSAHSATPFDDLLRTGAHAPVPSPLPPNTSYCPHPSSFSSVAYGRQRVPAPLSPHFSRPFLRLFSLLLFVGFEASGMGRLCGSKGGGVWLVKARGAWQVCPPYQSEWLYMYYGMYAGVCLCVFVLNSTKLKSFVCTMKDFNICSLYSSTWFPSRWHVDRKYRPFFLLAAIEYKIGSRFQFSHWAKGIFKIRSIYFTANYN